MTTAPTARASGARYRRERLSRTMASCTAASSLSWMARASCLTRGSQAARGLDPVINRDKATSRALAVLSLADPGARAGRRR